MWAAGCNMAKWNACAGRLNELDGRRPAPNSGVRDPLKHSQFGSLVGEAHPTPYCRMTSSTICADPWAVPLAADQGGCLGGQAGGGSLQF